jgi:hypothetical protein
LERIPVLIEAAPEAAMFFGFRATKHPAHGTKIEYLLNEAVSGKGLDDRPPPF